MLDCHYMDFLNFLFYLGFISVNGLKSTLTINGIVRNTKDDYIILKEYLCYISNLASWQEVPIEK